NSSLKVAFETSGSESRGPRASGSESRGPRASGSESRGTRASGSESRGTRAGTISAADAFKLHDTYGFPIDLTQVMAEERGMSVDVAGFEQLMEQARETSRAGGAREESFTLTPAALEELKRLKVRPTDDHHKYNARPG